MRIAFLSPLSRRLSHTAFLDPGLGGNETTYVLWAEEMARRGHEVDLHSLDPHRETHAGVRYRHLDDFDSNAGSYEMLIACRAPSVLRGGRRAPVQVLVLGDRHIEQAEAVTTQNCDFVWYNSWTQYETLAARFPSDIPFVIGSCGVEDALLTRPVAKAPLNFLHSSAPYRGLARMLKLWPAIRARHPDAVLHITGGYRLWGYDETQSRGFLENDVRAEDLDAPGIVYHGAVPREAYLELLSRCSYFVYPTAYEEMCCIAALEASALGVVPVVSGIAALRERVTHGVDGLLLAEGADDRDIVDTLFFASKSVELTNYLSRNARRTATAFSTSSMVGKLLDAVSDTRERQHAY